MLKGFESLVSRLEAAANEVVHDTRHFYSLSFFVISIASGDKKGLLSVEVVSKDDED